MPWNGWSYLWQDASLSPTRGEAIVCYYDFNYNVFRGFCQKENDDAFISLPFMEIIFKPPHLLVGQTVEFNL